MKHLKIFAVTLVILLIALSAHASGDDVGISPHRPSHGGKWRIAYYQGGDYIDYQKTLVATIQGLVELGWIDNMEEDLSAFKSNKELWKRLSGDAVSSYIRFVPDAFYTADWDKNIRKETATALVDRLNGKKDIDLVIAMGTWAGQDLANNSHQVPTLVMSTSNPLKSDIIKSIEDSGYDHVHARIDPYRYEHQIRLFYKTVNFKRLGVIYEDTVAGRSYAAIDTLEKLSKKMGFELVRCMAQLDIPDHEVADREYIKCFERLTKSADAVYVTVHTGTYKRTISQIVDLAIKNRIPTFSQTGSEKVKYGLLLSLSRKSFRGIGLFEAAVIAKVLNGAKPRDLPQVFESPRKLAINLETAEQIGFSLNLPIEVLAAADEFYREISKPE